MRRVWARGMPCPTRITIAAPANATLSDRARRSGYFRKSIASQNDLPRGRVMILGMSTATFTLLHVVLSLGGIFSGVVVLFELLGAKRRDGWTAILTSVTGFFFHSASFGPPHVIGVISLVVLTVAVLAFYVYRLGGFWRWLYVGGAVLALYLNVFVGVVQAFQKLPLLRPLAPTQSEPPFVVTQLVVLVIFVAIGVAAAKRFHRETRAPA